MINKGLRNLRKMGIVLAVISMLTVSSPYDTIRGYAEADVVRERLERIGTWEGVAAYRDVPMPYEDGSQQEVPFGVRSLYHAPWKSYMDTWDAAKYLNTLGINFNVPHEMAEPAAELLAEAGMRSARVEIGWANLDDEDDSKLRANSEAHIGTVLKALAKHHIRPMILLNANSGMPSPGITWKVNVLRGASQGERELVVDRTDGIKLHYTGLYGHEYPAMYPVVVDANAATGRLLLSAPLGRDIPAGPLELVKLKYAPFSQPYREDGSIYAASAETLDGWRRYVATVTGFVKEQLGTEGLPDAGFDLEVWNEYTFGSEFLDIRNYYEPDLKLTGRMEYEREGRKAYEHELILPLTADWVKDPSSGLPGVRVISGFANQRPWENGTELWPSVDGFSRHYYTGYSRDKALIAPGRTNPTKVYLNALGARDGQPDPASGGHTLPGTYAEPVHKTAFPESRFYAYETEFVTRDVQPFPGPMELHHRYSSSGEGRTASVWMTETNFYLREFADELAERLVIPLEDERLERLIHTIGAKSTLRNFMFYGHKGLETIHLYALRSEPGLSLMPERFFRELEKQSYRLMPQVRALVGPQLQALANVSAAMAGGRELPVTRPLKVEAIREWKPRLVFEGDGTAEHPSRYLGDDLAILPYQLDADSFAIGYYAVTRDLTHAWDSGKEVLDPQRYEMPEQLFDVTISNVRGVGAEVTAYDPMTGSTVPAETIEASDSWVKVRVWAKDYPRLLFLREAEPGPLLEAPRLKAWTNGAGAELVLAANVDGTAQVEWGPYPARSAGTFLEERFGFSDERFDSPVSARNVSTIEYVKGTPSVLPAEAGRWRWSGYIRPRYTETYTFQIRSDNYEDIRLRVGGQTLVEPMSGKLRAAVTLEAGKDYELVFEYWNRWSHDVHTPALYWMSDSEPPGAVTAASPVEPLLVQLQAGEPAAVQLPGFAPNDAVRVRFASDANGLRTQFPRWDYDWAGTLHR